MGVVSCTRTTSRPYFTKILLPKLRLRVTQMLDIKFHRQEVVLVYFRPEFVDDWTDFPKVMPTALEGVILPEAYPSRYSTGGDIYLDSEVGSIQPFLLDLGRVVCKVVCWFYTPSLVDTFYTESGIYT